MTLRHRLAVGAMLLATMLAAPSSALAEPKWAEADKHFRHGVALFKETSYAAALVEFKRAYEIDPKFQVLYNIAKSHLELQDYASALQAFRQYLDEGGQKIAPPRRKAVEKDIEMLVGRVATITITTNEPGASVTVDDVVVGTTPLKDLTVSAGRRRVTATLTGRVPVTRVVDLAGGDRETLELEIAPLPRPIERDKTPPPPPPSLVPPVVAWSATGVLATCAVITGVLALGASSDLEAELERFPADPNAIDSANGKAFGLGVATDVLIGASVVAAGISTYLTIDWALESDAAAATPPAKTGRVTVVPGGVVVGGTF